MGKKGYAWAISAGSNAALSAFAAKLISSPDIATNFAINFLASGFAGLALFGEPLKLQWFASAFLIITSTIEKKKERSD